MPLTMVSPGKTVVIRKVTGKDQLRQRLAELGFVTDSQVTVISCLAGSLILQVKESSGTGQNAGKQNYGLRKVSCMKTLRDAKVGDIVHVVKLHGEGGIRRRIMDMGITKGVDILIRKVAPLGDPMELNIRGYELSLRRSDAEMIEIE